ncbi:hypothetical protein F0562_026245 [Nyssa sinensis]|uniref:Uncharacterized protein n=1 Tax=Nyssa sinensis TaxID=561372 RepID=A0A5J5B8P6_9ASTE|nr:hypothetical protein F0562_026245 [Nyssa sinensis]
MATRCGGIDGSESNRGIRKYDVCIRGHRTAGRGDDSEGNRLYGVNFSSSSEMEKTKKSERGWKQATSMLNRRFSAAAASMDGKIYVFGGCSRETWQTDLWAEVFNPVEDQWKPLSKHYPSLEITSLAKADFFVVIPDTDSKKILVGCCSGSLLYSYDAVDHSWEEKYEKFYTFYSFSKPVAYNNTLYWLGYEKIHAYDLNLKQSFAVTWNDQQNSPHWDNWIDHELLAKHEKDLNGELLAKINHDGMVQFLKHTTRELIVHVDSPIQRYKQSLLHYMGQWNFTIHSRVSTVPQL